jgi:hypothetical protein
MKWGQRTRHDLLRHDGIPSPDELNEDHPGTGCTSSSRVRRRDPELPSAASTLPSNHRANIGKPVSRYTTTASTEAQGRHLFRSGPRSASANQLWL